MMSSGDYGTTKICTDGIRALDWNIHVKSSHWAGHIVRIIDSNSKTKFGRESRRKKVLWKAEEQVGRRNVA